MPAIRAPEARARRSRARRPAHGRPAHIISPTEGHAEDFAKELADFLRQKRIDQAYAGLVLVAEPRFLGRLRSNLDKPTAGLVQRELDKNWVRHDDDRIQQLLDE